MSKDEMMVPYNEVTIVKMQDLMKSEWSPRFEQLMRNRLIIGAMRYGQIHGMDKPLWNRIKAAKERLAIYEETGNLEMLVDIANFCLLEFEEGKHPHAHFKDDQKVKHVEIEE